MEKRCWEIKNCPAFYFETSCKAYKSGKNCWEIEDTICSVNHDNDVCEKCEVFWLAKISHLVPG
jgi:hypothetical protein